MSKLPYWLTYMRSGSYLEPHCSSVTQLCLTLCDPMEYSTPVFPVLHHLPELAQTHGHLVSDAIQPSHPLSSPSPPACNLSQHQDFFLMSWLFTSGGQRIGASASASVLLMKDWLGIFEIFGTNVMCWAMRSEQCPPPGISNDIYISDISTVRVARWI